MDVDLTLTDESVVIAGNRLDLVCPDLTINSPDRRGSAADGLRRALVHGDGDQLIINFNRDYTGGVVIPGPLHVGVAAQPASPSDFSVAGTVGATSQIEDGVATTATVDVITELGALQPPHNVALELNLLRAAVLQLSQRIEKLEAGGH